MKLFGRLFDGRKFSREVLYERPDDTSPLRDVLEDALIDVCKQLDISVPLWLGRNTNEFARYRKTVFAADQFVEEVRFSRFEIRIEL